MSNNTTNKKTTSAKKPAVKAANKNKGFFQPVWMYVILAIVIVATAVCAIVFTQPKAADEAPVNECLHTYQEHRCDATCTEGGYLRYDCAKCGDVHMSERFPALGHVYGEWEVTQEATANEAGTMIRKCETCGVVLSTARYVDNNVDDQE